MDAASNSVVETHDSFAESRILEAEEESKMRTHQSVQRSQVSEEFSSEHEDDDEEEEDEDILIKPSDLIVSAHLSSCRGNLTD